MTPFAKALLGAALLGVPALAGAAIPEGEATEDPAVTRVDEEIIVRGLSYGDLRRQIRLAQDRVYARFNDINSDDAFDIHCRSQNRYGSRMRERVCVSNSWREQDANIANAFVRQLQGFGGAPTMQFRAEQLLMQRRLNDEMQRLALADPELNQAVVQLGQAMLAMNIKSQGRPTWTLYREIAAGENGLPFAATRAVEVRMGREPWTHLLTQSTFTLGQVAGDIRGLELRCAGSSRDVDYAPGVEWTVPPGWTDCMLRVRAERGATFALYEFE